MTQRENRSLVAFLPLLVSLLLMLSPSSSFAAEPTGEILSNKWGYVIAAYTLSWAALLGYLYSLYKRGLR